MAARAACPRDKIRNPASGRCVKRDGAIGRALLAAQAGPQVVPLPPAAGVGARVPSADCPVDKIRNPLTGICVKRTGKIGQRVLAAQTVVKQQPVQTPALIAAAIPIQQTPVQPPAPQLQPQLRPATAVATPRSRALEQSYQEITRLLDANNIRIERRALSDMYTDLKEIGRGGFGVVYTGTRVRSNGRTREVAVKELDFTRRLNSADDMQVYSDIESAMESAKNEIQIQLQLQCTPTDRDCAIVPIYDFFTNEDATRVCVEMKLIRGYSCREWIRRLKGTEAKRTLHDEFILDSTVILPNFVRLCKTMNNLHQRGILHRDIKPENLLFEVSTERMYLIDFGLACILPRCSGTAGTYRYMDPRTRMRTPNLKRIVTPDHLSDVYALGLTFSEFLNRRNLREMFHNSALDLPKQLEEALRRLSAVPLQRYTKYQTAYEELEEEEQRIHLKRVGQMMSLVDRMVHINHERPSFPSIVAHFV